MHATGKALEVRRTTLPATTGPSIALALGGGGARGLAHILMLEVFDELGLRPKIIAGTSIGAIFGAAYAAGLPAKLIRAHAEEALGQRFDIFRQLLVSRAEPVVKILNILPVRSALLKPELVLDFFLPSKVPQDFSGLQIPLKIVATDFYQREQVVIERGPLRGAVAASMALPALFAPVIADDRVMMDGGLVNPLPFDLLLGEADVTVAIDVSGASTTLGKHLQPTAFNALIASSQILQRSIVREKLKAQQPDIYVDVAVDEFNILGFHRFKDILAAAQPAKDQLRRQLQRVLSSQTVEANPATAVPAEPAQPPRRRGFARLRRPGRGLSR
ncbi:MAG TPA: patatin-like phospholipase family protein [Hyphomicrobiaceae bacterium]|nr:patatin-like phospholipase family protein [Hyphomicrobiaceae bacterium]